MLSKNLISLLPGCAVVGGVVLASVLLRPAPVRAATYSDAVIADAPIAYWRLGDAGGTATDSSGNSHDGTSSGAAVTFGTEGLVPAEEGDGAVTFNGLDRIVVPGFEKIGANGHSAEYWIKIDAYPEACCSSIVSDGVAGGDFFMMNYLIGPTQGTTGTIRPHYSFANTPVSLTNTTPLELDTVYHVVTTWDPTQPNNNNGKIYVNGTLSFEGNVTGVVPGPGDTGDNAIYLGRDDRENVPSNFVLDEVALYTYALSEQQVAAHYQIGTTAVPEPSSVCLAILGLSGVAVLAWRRRRTRPGCQ